MDIPLWLLLSPSLRAKVLVYLYTLLYLFLQPQALVGNRRPFLRQIFFISIPTKRSVSQSARAIQHYRCTNKTSTAGLDLAA